MTDIFAKDKRSEIMSKIKSKNTKPELILKELLDGRIFKYHPVGIVGNPDFGSRKHQIAVFVDGCFWHGGKGKTIPKTNTDFWFAKIERNKKRDRKTNKKLKSQGYKVFRFWDYEVIKDSKRIVNTLKKEIRSSKR